MSHFSALSLTYFLDTQEDWMVGRGSTWEANSLAVVKAQEQLPHIKIRRFSSLTLEQELEENTNSVFNYISLNIGIMIVFCIIMTGSSRSLSSVSSVSFRPSLALSPPLVS